MLNQSLSALMDGELDDCEIEVLLDRIRHDPALRAAWGRQHYLRISICERPPCEIDSGFADHIMSRIAAEEAELNARTRFPSFHKRSATHFGIRRRGWHRPVAGLAVAASVAVVAVLVIDQGSVSTTTAVTAPAVATTTAATASAPHAERVARSEAAAQASDGATTVAVSAQQPATTAAQVPQTQQAVQKIEEVAARTDSSAVKTVAADQDNGAASAASVAGTQLEQLIGTKQSPLSWDAASAAQEQQLRSLIPKQDSAASDSGSGPSSLLGYMHMTSDKTAAKTASATKGEAAPQH